MKILHITQSLDPSWGGIARVLPMLVGELAAAGETCRVAVLEGDRFGTPRPVPDVELLKFPAKKNSRLGRSGEFERAIGRLVAEADVVHLHGLWAGQNWFAGRAARKAGRPVVITPHSMMMPWAWQRSRWKKRFAGWLFEHENLRSAACLHALAEGEAGHMRALGFNQNIEVIANGLHVSEFAQLPSVAGLEERLPPVRGRKWLLFLGRIAEQKGIVPMMQGCFDVLAASDEWHLMLAGPDEFGLQKMLDAAIRRKKMTDRVTFAGMLSREEVLACLGRASVLLQPSLSEGMSMSILEALAAGLPVLISEACNLPEVVEDGAGCVIAPERGAIAAALRKFTDMSDEERETMGRRGRELAKRRFDWSVLVPKYQEMYAKLLTERM